MFNKKYTGQMLISNKQRRENKTHNKDAPHWSSFSPDAQSMSGEIGLSSLMPIRRAGIS